VDGPIKLYKQDAHKLADRLRTVEFNRAFTSPLRLARRTCELAGLGKVAEIEPDLAEWDSATRRDSALWIFARHGQTGMSFEADAQAANRPLKFPNAQIG